MPAGTSNSFNLSKFCLQDVDHPAIRNANGRVIRSIDFYDDLAKWTAIEVIEGLG